MCECCSHNAATHQGHIHVYGVSCSECFSELQELLSEVPGVINVEFVESAEQAKIVFDKRILEITNLEEVLDQNGFGVS